MFSDRYENGIRYVSGDLGEWMVFSSAQLDECVEIFNARGYENASLAFVYYKDGYNETDLEVLRKIKPRKLIIGPEIIEDFSAIHTQDQLEYLRITDVSPKADIDFSKLPALKTFEGFWSKSFRNLFGSQSVTELAVIKYVSKSGDLTELSEMQNLETLLVSHSNLKSLRGLEKLKKLKTFTLSNNRAPVILSIELIDSLPVTSLAIWSSKKVNFDSIGVFAKIKKLNLNGIGEIISLKKILKALPLLEELKFEDSTMTEGNNLYFLDHPALRKVSIDDKKHYLLKASEINEALQDPIKNAALRKKHV
jgi:hypothetical protein